MRFLAAILFLVGCPVLVAQGQVSLKQAAAPGAEIKAGHLRLPDAWLHASRIQGAIVRVQPGTTRQVWMREGALRVVPLGTAHLEGEIQVGLGRDLALSLSDWRSVGDVSVEEVAAVDAWTELAPRRYEFRLQRDSNVTLRNTSSEEVTLLVGDDRPVWLEHTVTHAARLLQARLLWKGKPLGERIVHASVRYAQKGRESHGTLRESHSGVWQASLPEAWTGEFQAWIEVQGIDSEGHRFTRAAVQTVELSHRLIDWNGPVQVEQTRNGFVDLVQPVRYAGPEGRVHWAAEVWAHNQRGEWEPMCWLARQVDVGATGRLTLQLDRRWFERSGLQEPIELRQVRVQDPAHWQVLMSSPVRAVPTLPARVGPLAQGSLQSLVVTQSMGSPTSGANPLTPASPGTLLPSFGLMLVHGWCSSGGVWPTNQFGGPLMVYNDPNANRSHDEFAQLMAQLAGTRRSFGVVAHSQGGAAALHLLTYYSTGLDRADQGRRIQSLATPYQGTPLANLGFILCGNNTDMSPTGAAAWLANIPMASRAEVYYYTTSGNGGSCSFLTDFFLSNPEDGTIEQSGGQLPGAHNMGHTVGWCHTTGMSDPAGYTDASRNAVLDANAAR